MRFSLYSSKVDTTKIVKNNIDYIPIQCLLNFKFASNMYGSNLLEQIIKKSLGDRKEPIGLLEQFLNTDLNESRFKYDFTNSGRSCRGYQPLFNYKQNTIDVRKFWSSDGLIRGNFSLGEYGINSQIIYNLCVKKKYVRYFLQCILLEKEPDNRIFILVIDNTFDTPLTFAPRVRLSFRKYIRKRYLELGIELKYENNLDELFFETFKLKASTPMELKQIKKDLVLELLTI